MRTWIGGGLLATATAGGLVFVFAGFGNPSHCGVCIVPETATAGPSCCESGVCPPTDETGVVEVIDVSAVLSRPAAPGAFVSFEEPPLAHPRADASPVMHRPGGRPDIMQAAFIEPIADGPAVEVAPRPRRVAAPGEVLLGSPNDPF